MKNGYGKAALSQMARERAERDLDEALDEFTARGGSARSERVQQARRVARGDDTSMWE
jgi:hypothetical protein